jgi:hypothetical protein
MNPIEHILVIVDPTGSGRRQSAVNKAMILAQRFHASVELLIFWLCDPTRVPAPHERRASEHPSTHLLQEHRGKLSLRRAPTNWIVNSNHE